VTAIVALQRRVIATVAAVVAAGAARRGRRYGRRSRRCGPEQLIHDGRFEWNWKVKPLKSGDHELQLVTSLLAPVPGMGTKQSVLHSDYRHLRVHVSPIFALGQFLAEYWQWVTSSIAIPLLAWAWKKKWERKRGSKVGFAPR
jgi:hypothetical protein